MSGITDKPRILSDSITHTREMISECIRGIAPEHQRRAKGAAMQIEAAFQAARKDAPRDPAVALGVAFAIFTIADRLIELEQEAGERGRGLIQLL